MAGPNFDCVFNGITGIEARELLMNEGSDGSFLIRPSSTGHEEYSLSVRRKNDVIHIKIQNTGEFYVLNGDEMFATLPQLVEYYCVGEGKNALSEKNKDPIRLVKPMMLPKHRSERWFHTNLSSSEAETKLKKSEKKDTFLVRESKSKVGDFVLSYYTGEEVVHVFIHKENGHYTIKDGVNMFGSLVALIDHYRDNEFTVKCMDKTHTCKLQKSLLGGVVGFSQFDSKVSELEKEFQVNGKTKTGFLEEFEHIQHLTNKNEKLTTVGQKPENKSKNRYRNILPYDETRVILKNPLKKDDFSDYINANYIEVPKSLASASKKFIATQGCLKATVADFWSMVWQEKVKIIVMATELIENGKHKCAQYWPETPQDPLQLNCLQGNCTVSLASCQQKQVFALRTFEVTCNKESREVYQFHHQQWPDRCAPNDVSAILDFLLEINKFSKDKKNSENTPWVIHCSAGIGRTGTFILLDIIINHILKEGIKSEINIMKILMKMRTQRAGMVQLEKQYAFVYKAVQNFLNNFYQTSLKNSNNYMTLESIIEFRSWANS